MKYKARFRPNSDVEYQTLARHLEETGMYTELFSIPIGLPKPALLTALVHDFGKYSSLWQEYLEKSNKTGKKDTILDHAAAGGQYIYENLIKTPGKINEIIAQLLAACVMYHHGPGLPDIIEIDGTAKLSIRMEKTEDETHKNESFLHLDDSIKQKINEILTDPDFLPETYNVLHKLTEAKTEKGQCFNLGLTARFLSSCLIDGDRRSSADYEKDIPVTIENAVAKTDWNMLCERLETHLAKFPKEGRLNEIRRDVSDRCAEFAGRGDGIYTLTAATGTGKTLASLRYALERAQSSGKDRIFIIAPYTSILDQNAKEIRAILNPSGKNGEIILEHHSNLDKNEKNEYTDEATETWNVPIVITTMVQFLESLFGSGTRKIRRMHQLANSVIILDEVQTLPASCTYLFNWAIQYLVQNANVSILLTTATQPGLNKLEPDYALPLSTANEIIPDITRHFNELKRVKLIDKTNETGWTLAEVSDFMENLEEKNILIVVNTKAQAWKLFNELSSKHPDWEIVHLSANMCPAHRKDVIKRIREEYLYNKKKKCICISTRLIEAGVDLSFDCAIRFLAGFDSIIQTAGRCNRNGELKDINGNPVTGNVYIINIVKAEEKISSLPDLILGQQQMNRILREFKDNGEKYNYELMNLQLIENYFHYYYLNIPESILKHKISKRDDTILDLLSDNQKSNAEYINKKEFKKWKIKPLQLFRQSFEKAWEEFRVISQDTIGVIVPFMRGYEIICELHGEPTKERCLELLREAQLFSVNVFPDKLQEMIKTEILKKVKSRYDFDIYTVNDKYYDQKIGLTDIEGRFSTNLA